MMKRMSQGAKEENYEHVLMCLICRSLFDDFDHQPKFLPCHHTFCKDCLREYVRQMGDEIECPSCRKIANIPAAGVAALQTNFYVKYIQGLVQGGCMEGSVTECSEHPARKLQYFCKDCSASICDQCCSVTDQGQCQGHKKVPITTATEDLHQKLDTSFLKANALIERKKVELEGMLKALCEEKDSALLKIDSTFEQHVHTLNRRATLLKNKVIDIYNEHVCHLESDMEEISTAMTCIVSLKEYHERKISAGDFKESEKGIEEMEEVFGNITDRINPKENHIIFEERHGIEKFRAGAKDLGRVRCNRPTIPRTAPEGTDGVCGTDGDKQDESAPNTPTNVSDVENSPQTSASSTMWSAFSEQATGGTTTPSPADVSQSSKVSATQDLESGMSHSQSHPTTSTDDKEVKKVPLQQDPAAQLNGVPKGAPAQLMTNGLTEVNANGAACGAGTSDNGCPAVRPKTLDTASRRVPRGGNIVKPVKGKKSPAPDSNGNHHLSYPGMGAKPESRSVTGKGPPLQLSDIEKRPSCIGQVAKEIAAARKADPLPDTLKDTDKMYHHLVYTSYDEEELLKELKLGKAMVDSQESTAVAASARRILEASDSWATISSEDSIVCEQQSTL